MNLHTLNHHRRRHFAGHLDMIHHHRRSNHRRHRRRLQRLRLRLQFHLGNENQMSVRLNSSHKYLPQRLQQKVFRLVPRRWQDHHYFQSSQLHRHHPLLGLHHLVTLRRHHPK